MAYLAPRKNHSLFPDFMMDPFDSFFGSATPTSSTNSLMRTDIKQHEGGYELIIDLPGFKKENVAVQLKEGVLTVSAQTATESEEESPKGTWVRKERFSGKCSRSFMIGDEIEEADIKAKFDNGTLQISIPKKQAQPELEEPRSIAID